MSEKEDQGATVAESVENQFDPGDITQRPTPTDVERRAENIVIARKSDLEPTTIPTNPPQIGVKPGWQTSQGQMTALFTLIALVLSIWAGKKITAGQVQNVYDAAVLIVSFVAPLGAGLKMLVTYTNSRGKLYSNAAWASASIHNPLVRNDNLDDGWVSKLFEVLQSLRAGSAAAEPFVKTLPQGGKIPVVIDRGQEVIERVETMVAILTELTGQLQSIKTTLKPVPGASVARERPIPPAPHSEK